MTLVTRIRPEKVYDLPIDWGPANESINRLSEQTKEAPLAVCAADALFGNGFAFRERTTSIFLWRSRSFRARL